MFTREFRDRIFLVRMKETALQADIKLGSLASYVNFGHRDRGWDFRPLGRGGVDFEETVRAPNHIGCDGPLSVRSEDSGIEQESDAVQASEFTKSVNFHPSNVAFDAAFEA